MSLHRLVALASVTTLLGLLGAAASASNHVPYRPVAPKAAEETSFSAKPDRAENPSATENRALREKIEKADIDGCGG